MALRTSVSAKPQLQGRLKLAHLLKMPEDDFESRVKEIEGNPLFERLRATGAVRLENYEGARFGARRFGGWGLRTASDGLPDALDADSVPVVLIQRVGQERFEEFFLRDAHVNDQARARSCGISVEEAKLLREFVDKLYIQTEFQSPSTDAAPPKTFSAVAGVEIVNGKPVLAFFNREIWKGRYCVNSEKCAQMREALSPRERASMENLLRQLEFLDRRKTTLFQALEELLRAQADFFVSGESGRRRPLTQRHLAGTLEVSPSVIHHLISNKSIQLPWGLETPMRTLVPSAKTLLRDSLYDIAVAAPDASDETLRRELERRTGAKLSRRSIAQYRKELKLGGRGDRRASA
jgi:RNA polymerase sigma-54 factor